MEQGVAVWMDESDIHGATMSWLYYEPSKSSITAIGFWNRIHYFLPHAERIKKGK